MAEFTAKRLSSRDKRLVNALRLTEEELARDITNSTSPASIAELTRTIEQTKNPAIRQILEEEYGRVQTQLAASKKQEPVAVIAPQPTAPITIESVFNAIASYFTK